MHACLCSVTVCISSVRKLACYLMGISICCQITFYQSPSLFPHSKMTPFENVARIQNDNVKDVKSNGDEGNCIVF